MCAFERGKKGMKFEMSKFDKLFEIPEELTNDVPKVTVVGFNRMLIENYKCVLEYQSVFIRIKMHNGLINITGLDLQMNEMTSDDLIITGTIDSIEFEKLL